MVSPVALDKEFKEGFSFGKPAPSLMPKIRVPVTVMVATAETLEPA